ncbi:MAG: homoserine kinase [Gemmatimonadaceae bacterium]
MSTSICEGSVISSSAGSTQRVVSVSVPASTSNLGAGFDAVGMAIGRWLHATARVTGSSRAVSIKRAGTLASLDLPDETDLIWRGFIAACVALRVTPPIGIEIEANSDIPVARGLGSSAAAIVAGVLLANALLDGELDNAAVIDIASALEGHPDNVAPAVLGGAVLCLPSIGHHSNSVPLTVHPSLRFVFIVPDFEVRTEVARAVLPAKLDFATSVSAAARAAALVIGLQGGDATVLEPALDDVLHVPFRRSLVKGYDAVTEAAVSNGAIGATLSGSGSTIVAIVNRGRQAAVGKAAVAAWRAIDVAAFAFSTAPELHGAITGGPTNQRQFPIF